jgi:hypothetical protein
VRPRRVPGRSGPARSACRHSTTRHGPGRWLPAPRQLTIAGPVGTDDPDLERHRGLGAPAAVDDARSVRGPASRRRAPVDGPRAGRSRGRRRWQRPPRTAR